MIPNDYHNFGPRAGFAYQLTGDGKTVVRGGIGVFYFVDRGGISNQLAQNPPFSGAASFKYTDGFRIALSGQAPMGSNDATLATGPVPTGAAAFANLDYAAPVNVSVVSQLTRNLTPQVTEWNLQLQRQLGNNSFVSLGYVGTHGAHLPDYYNANQYSFGEDTNTPGSQLWPLISQISTYDITYGKSNFHSLQAEYQRRMMQGLQITGSFLHLGEADRRSLMARTIAVRRRTSATCTSKRAFRTSIIAVPPSWPAARCTSFPFGHGKARGANWNRPLEIALGGWQFNGIYTLSSGLPFDVSVGGTVFANQGALPPTFRPDPRGHSRSEPGPASPATSTEMQVCAQPAVTYYADTQQTVPNAPGTAGRNLLIGPGLSNLDFSLVKNFHVTERVNVSFRAQYYNITNTPALRACRTETSATTQVVAGVLRSSTPTNSSERSTPSCQTATVKANSASALRSSLAETGRRSTPASRFEFPPFAPGHALWIF